MPPDADIAPTDPPTSSGDRAHPFQHPRHPPTTTAELIGFCCFSAITGAEIVGVTGLIPNFFAELWRRDTCQKYTKHSSLRLDECYAMAVLTDDMVEGITADTAALLFNSAGVFLLLATILFVGGAADFGRFRKDLQMVCHVVGSCSLLIPAIFVSEPRHYPAIGFSITCGFFCFNLSQPLLNSYISRLAACHPSVLAAPREERVSKQESAEDLISAYGLASGFGSALVMAGVANHLSKQGHEPILYYRLVQGGLGGLWLLFSLVGAALLHPRPGPKLGTCLAPFVYAVPSSLRAVQSLRKLRNARLFLLYYFLASHVLDRFADTLLLFGQLELGLDEQQLSAFILIGTGCGVAGAILAEIFLAHKCLSRKRVNGLSMVVFSLCSLYVSLGLWLPIGGRKGQAEEFNYLIAVYALCFGAFESVARTLYASVVPSEQIAQFYLLLEAVRSFSSLLSGIVLSFFGGNLRPAFIYLFITGTLGLVPLSMMTLSRERLAFECAAAYEYQRSSSSAVETTSAHCGMPSLGGAAHAPLAHVPAVEPVVALPTDAGAPLQPSASTRTGYL